MWQLTIATQTHLRYNISEGLMKTIYLEKKYPNEQILGQFLDESHYDILIEEDCDVYKPLEYTVDAFGNEIQNGEHNLLLKFRKGVFSPELVKMAYEGLRDAAGESQNRGIAAGPRTEKSTGRDWVTALQERLIDVLSGSMNTVTSDDPIAEAYAKAKTSEEVSTKGRVWLTLKRPAGFDFDAWVEKTAKLSYKDRLKEVEIINDWISDTTYANPVFSGIAGYFDKYPRIPYCRLTSYTANHKEMFEKAIPFIEAVSEQFKELVPDRYEVQKAAMSHLDPAFRIGNSVYTTVTVNKNYRTAAHRDAGDFKEGFGNLSTTYNGVDWDGCYLIFPEYRAAVSVKPGDFLAMDIHEIHGNTPVSSESGLHERISIVCYMREKMMDCRSKTYEDTRYNFIESRKRNKNHPLWYDKWNGVSAGWDTSEEWYKYLVDNGLHEYAAEIEDVVYGKKVGVLDI